MIFEEKRCRVRDPGNAHIKEPSGPVRRFPFWVRGEESERRKGQGRRAVKDTTPKMGGHGRKGRRWVEEQLLCAQGGVLRIRKVHGRKNLVPW